MEKKKKPISTCMGIPHEQLDIEVTKQAHKATALQNDAPKEEVEYRKPSRFDYIAYDCMSQRDQEEAKKAAMALETVIDMIMPELTNRAKENAINALEECYMWIGKGIRDQQIKTNSLYKLQEQRVES